MRPKNCKNCGAPLHGDVCEYCGTEYREDRPPEVVFVYGGGGGCGGNGGAGGSGGPRGFHQKGYMDITGRWYNDPSQSAIVHFAEEYAEQERLARSSHKK